MAQGSKAGRGIATLVAALSVAGVLALAVAAGAAPATARASTRRVMRPRPAGPALSIHPDSGSIGTMISYEGECGARVHVVSPTIVAWGASFAHDARGATRSLAQFGFGFTFDSPTGLATFTGKQPVPATLADGTRVKPGIYYVRGGCLCAALESCPGTPSAEVGFIPSVLLPPQPFCVVPCLDDGWGRFVAERLGAGGVFVRTIVGTLAGLPITPFLLPPTTPPVTSPPVLPGNGGPVITVPTAAPTTAATAPETEPPTTATSATTTTKPCFPKPPYVCP